jgi:hypothetical protein
LDFAAAFLSVETCVSWAGDGTRGAGPATARETHMRGGQRDTPCKAGIRLRKEHPGACWQAAATRCPCVPQPSRDDSFMAAMGQKTGPTPCQRGRKLQGSVCRSARPAPARWTSHDRRPLKPRMAPRCWQQAVRGDLEAHHLLHGHPVVLACPHARRLHQVGPTHTFRSSFSDHGGHACGWGHRWGRCQLGPHGADGRLPGGKERPKLWG